MAKEKEVALDVINEIIGSLPENALPQEDQAKIIEDIGQDALDKDEEKSLESIAKIEKMMASPGYEVQVYKPISGKKGNKTAIFSEGFRPTPITWGAIYSELPAPGAYTMWIRPIGSYSFKDRLIYSFDLSSEEFSKLYVKSQNPQSSNSNQFQFISSPTPGGMPMAMPNNQEGMMMTFMSQMFQEMQRSNREMIERLEKANSQPKSVIDSDIIKLQLMSQQNNSSSEQFNKMLQTFLALQTMNGGNSKSDDDKKFMYDLMGTLVKSTLDGGKDLSGIEKAIGIIKSVNDMNQKDESIISTLLTGAAPAIPSLLTGLLGINTPTPAAPANNQSVLQQAAAKSGVSTAPADGGGIMDMASKVFSGMGIDLSKMLNSGNGGVKQEQPQLAPPQPSHNAPQPDKFDQILKVMSTLSDEIVSMKGKINDLESKDNIQQSIDYKRFSAEYSMNQADLQEMQLQFATYLQSKMTEEDLADTIDQLENNTVATYIINQIEDNPDGSVATNNIYTVLGYPEPVNDIIYNALSKFVSYYKMSLSEAED